MPLIVFFNLYICCDVVLTTWHPGYRVYSIKGDSRVAVGSCWISTSGVTLLRRETVNIVYTLECTVQLIKGFNSVFLCVSLPSRYYKIKWKGARGLMISGMKNGISQVQSNNIAFTSQVTLGRGKNSLPGLLWTKFLFHAILGL